MSMIEYTRCPKCGTLFDVSNIDFSDSKGWVQCGDCTHQFEADKHAVNYSALLEQSILANMDEMSGSKRDFSIGQLGIDMSVTEMSNVSVSENIDLFDAPLYGSREPDSDYVETEFEPTTPNTEEGLKGLDEAIHDALSNKVLEEEVLKEEVLEEEIVVESEAHEVTEEFLVDSSQPELTEESHAVLDEFDDVVSEDVIQPESSVSIEQSNSFDPDHIYADLDDTSVESTWSKVLVASLAVPFLLALLLSFVFQLQKRDIVDWIPETYQKPLQTKWLSFLDQSGADKIDLSKIHLSSTRMEPHPKISGATTIVLQLINRANVNQSFPDFEISFTDGNGAVVARRVLKPFDYLDADQLNMLESKQAKTLRLNLASMPDGAVGYEIQVTQGS